MTGLTIFDSDVLIDHLRGREGAREYVSKLGPADLAACSVITVAEIMAGLRKDEEPATMALIDSMVVLPVDRRVAELGGKLKLLSGKRHVELDDCLIAATAIVHQAALVTHNPKHYPFNGLDLRPARY